MSKKSLWDRLDDWDVVDETYECLIVIARIDAVHRKWPGGLGAYLSYYHADQNDGVVSNYAVDLDFEWQLICLIENGFVLDADFIFIDARDRCSDIDGSPFTMPVSWLGGLYCSGRVLAFMRQ